MNGDPGAGAVDPLGRAERYLAHGPALPWGESSNLGRPGLVARQALHRVLRPHLVREAEFQAAIVEAVSAILAAVREADSHTSDVAGGLEAQLGAGRERLDEIMAALVEQLDDHGERLARVELEQRYAHDYATGRVGELVERGQQAEDAAARAQERQAAARAEIAERVRELGHRIAALESRAAARPCPPGAPLMTLDDEGREAIGFRADTEGAGAPGGLAPLVDGSEDAVRQRRRELLPALAGRLEVLELGCGRGELLDVLSETGISCRGVEADSELVARCREKGHAVEPGEPLELLDAEPDRSVDALAAAELVERLSYADLERLLALARAKLAAGGELVLQTRNPRGADPSAGAALDPRLRAQLLPEALVALLRSHGFASALVSFPSGSGALREDRGSQPFYTVQARAPG